LTQRAEICVRKKEKMDKSQEGNRYSLFAITYRRRERMIERVERIRGCLWEGTLTEKGEPGLKGGGGGEGLDLKIYPPVDIRRKGSESEYPQKPGSQRQKKKG